MQVDICNIIIQCVGEKKKRMSKQFKESNVSVTVSVGKKNDTSEIFKNGIP